jgi:hypothetical protein
MRTRITSGIILLLLSASLFSQSSDKTVAEKTFHSIGTSSFLDIYNGPICERFTSVTDPFGNTTSNYEYARISGYSYFTLIYHYRYNLNEINDNTALSINAFPSAGLFSGSTGTLSPGATVIPQGFGCFNLPVMAGLEVGAAATQKSNSPVGLFLGAGYEFNSAPLVYTRTVDNRYVKTKWVNPCVSIGLRYEKNMSFGTLQELNLKIGLGISTKEIKEPNNLNGGLYTFPKTFTFRLSYLTYLNY